ncbi:hypothetical protein [Streptomyces sp. NPDC002952]
MRTRTTVACDADDGPVRHDLGVRFTAPHRDNRAAPWTDLIPTRRRKNS